MNDSSRYQEARQHLNLSNIAYDIVEHDKNELLEKPSDRQILNHIFTMYCDYAEANISNACDAYQEKLEEQLKEFPSGEEKDKMIALLRDAHRQELIHTVNSYPFEHAFKFQLTQENYEYISSWKDSEEAYDSIPGRFIKAVIEGYARKPYVEREKIVFRKLIEQVETCISTKRALIITMKDRKRHEVRPYGICTDKGYNYNYLVGLSKEVNSKEDERIATFLISNISAYKSSSRSGRLTEAQKKEIADKILAVGVQFLVNNPETIAVRLTDKGKRMYERQAHLRPAYQKRCDNHDGTWTYEFDCTARQVRYFFFKYGADAEVLYPAYLRDSFRKQYEDALAIYSK